MMLNMDSEICHEVKIPAWHSFQSRAHSTLQHIYFVM